MPGGALQRARFEVMSGGRTCSFRGRGSGLRGYKPSSENRIRPGDEKGEGRRQQGFMKSRRRKKEKVER
jgi:hypothetical protein